MGDFLFCRGQRPAGCSQRRHCQIEGRPVAQLGTVRRYRDDAGIGQDVKSQVGQHALGADLDEYPGAQFVHLFDALDPAHRRSDLLRQPVEVVAHGGRIGIVRLCIDVGHQRDPRGMEIELGQHLAQRLHGGCDDVSMEGVRHRKRDSPDLGLLEPAHGLVERCAGAGDHRLPVAVHVGRDNSLEPVEGSQDLVERRQGCGHFARVVDFYAGHLTRPRRHRPQRLRVGQHAGNHQGGVFSQAVAGHHVRADAVLFEQARQSHVACQHGRLADVGVPQRLAGRGGVLGIDECAQRFAQDGLYDAVGLAEGLLDDWFLTAQFLEHADVLRSLSREDEGDLGLVAAAAEDALSG